MEKVSTDDLENNARTASVTKRLTDPLGLSDMALNYFELDPGESFSGGMHTHMEQEEAFFVLDGEATFETPDDEVVVDAGEAIRFAPGEYQEGRNESEDRVTALAFGAPQEMGETRVLVPCRACDDAEYHVTHVQPDGVLLECPECANEIAV